MAAGPSSSVYRSACWAYSVAGGTSSSRGVSVNRVIRGTPVGGTPIGRAGRWKGCEGSGETEGRKVGALPPFRPRRVLRPYHQLSTLNDLPIPRQDDEALGLERVIVGRVLAGLERDGRAHFGRLERADLTQREPHGASGVAGLIHHQDPAAPDRGGRP